MKIIEANHLLNRIIEFLSGEFDNFQQAWLENTETDMHRVEIAVKHRHFHSIFERLSTENEGDIFFKINHSEGRNKSNIVDQQLYKFGVDENDTVYTKVYSFQKNEDLSDLGEPIEKIIWQEKRNKIVGLSQNHNTSITIEEQLLTIRQKTGIFNHSISAYDMIKCRFFSGFMEVPISADDPDNMYRMGDLVLHDQGGIIQLKLEDGTLGAYTVELTQLVFAKTIYIMKLAVYQDPISDIHYDSHSISYTWTEPDSKRIGINLRKIITGWTFIEPGFISSNNLNK